MDLTTMTETIQDFIYDLRAEQRLYPDHYAADLAKAIVAAQGDDTFEPHARKDAPDTSHAVFDKIRNGNLQDQVLQAFINLDRINGVGATDDDIEVALGRAHQSVSAARNSLVRKGYLVDTGERRPNRHGNMAVRWAYTGKQVQR